MGAIFRADTFEHFTPRAVNLITQAAMQEVTKDPDSLGAFSWRSYLPTMAIAVASSDEERLALGDWRDKELLKQSEAIALRYADAKSGMSRRIKTKLSRVQQSLRRKNCNKFDDVTNSQWKAMVDEASVRQS